MLFRSAKELEEDIKAKAAEEEKKDEGVDIFKLQPKKPNWDLKRDLEQKLEILNVRTDNAIAQLVRERITGAKKTEQNNAAAQGRDYDGDVIGMEGTALVEGARLREQEEKEEEEREDAEMRD